MNSKVKTVTAIPGNVKDEEEVEMFPAIAQFASQFEGVLSTLTAFRSQITMLQNQIRGLEKNVKKQIKVLAKEAKKNKSKGNRKPSGFAVPSKISAELCEFMNKPPKSEVARTEVTQFIIAYIKNNKLQWQENRKIIKPDTALKTLLGNEDEEVTYFNLQRYMNKHFIKKIKKTAVTSA